MKTSIKWQSFNLFLSIKMGPERDDGFPEYITWNGEDYETPDLEQIRRWVFDSVCETLDGQQIEPDGKAFNGCPSWLLALGLV